jgi:hypothetical protein
MCIENKAQSRLPSIAPEITAILKDSAVDYDGRLVGFIYDDERFDNGTFVRTSMVVDKFSLYRTLSGNYYLVEDNTDGEPRPRSL